MTIIIMIIDLYSYFVYIILKRHNLSCVPTLTSVPCLNILCRSPTEPVKKPSSYRAVNTQFFGYKNQSVNDV